MRDSIRAPKGTVVLECDSSQVEVRVAGDLSGEPVILDVFRQGRDPYREFAMSLYDRETPEAVTKSERQIAKSAVLAAVYGQGWRGFQIYCRSFGIDITDEEAERTIRVYRSTHPQVVRMWRESERALRAMSQGVGMDFGAGKVFRTAKEVITLPSGRLLRYTDIHYDSEDGNYVYRNAQKRHDTKLYGSKLWQNLVQATAYDVVMWQAEKLFLEYDMEPVLQVHDALAYVVPEAEVEEKQKIIESVMRETPPFLNGVPLDCESGHGATYADV